MKNGIVRKVIGPVVDVQFPNGHLPEIDNAIEVTVEGRKIVMEAVQHLGQDGMSTLYLPVFDRRHVPRLPGDGHGPPGPHARRRGDAGADVQRRWRAH